MPFLIELGENPFMRTNFVNIYFSLVLIFSLTLPAHAADSFDIKKELTKLESVQKNKDISADKYEYVIIDFWASWCDPCKESIPYYEKLEKDYPKNKVLFLTINLDDEKKESEKFLKEFPSVFNVYWDKEKFFMKKLDFDSIPHLIVLDKNWNLIESVKGYNSKSKSKVKAYFKK